MEFSTFTRLVGAGVLLVWLTAPTAPSFAPVATALLAFCALTAAVDSLSQRLDWQALGYLVMALLYNPIVPVPEALELARWQVDLPCLLFLLAPRLKRKDEVLGLSR